MPWTQAIMQGGDWMVRLDDNGAKVYAGMTQGWTIGRSPNIDCKQGREDMVVVVEVGIEKFLVQTCLWHTCTATARARLEIDKA